MAIDSANKLSSVAGALPIMSNGTIDQFDRRQFAGNYRLGELATGGSVLVQSAGNIRTLLNPKPRTVSLSFTKV